MNTLKTKILFLARSKILQHLFRFGRLYKLFSWLIIGLIASIILSLLKRSIDVDWVLSIFSLTAIIFLLLGTLRSIRAGIYCVEIPALIAIIMAIVLGQYWASFIVTLVLVGRQPLEGLAALQASRHRAELSKHLPISAQLLRKHKIISVQVSDLIINDKIILQIGDIVPVDAVILEGSGNFDESILSGEIKHQLKSVGDQILSGSINTDGTITAKVIRTSMESQHHQIIQITRSAVASSSPIIKRLDRYSIFFILSSFIIGGAAWAITGHPLRFLEVIIVAAPSSFILAPTIALVTGMNRALREGIIVKTGRVFEKLADAKTITFNKTSLMSTEAPKV
ncbi:MAG: HAD-IC family P-type ATPase, partial [Candidatus Saccharimonadales bacterium]